MSHVTTHVLDAVVGAPAAGVAVELAARVGETWRAIAAGVTDADGRIGDLGPEVLTPGVYEISFATGMYFAALDRESFYPAVTITFEIVDREHYHVPLLLSPFAYSTYRGS